jgi:DNA polymerase-3 subunit delta'
MSAPIPHPRESFAWVGDEAHERAFVDALQRGRLHHAWLVIGPPGVGKATFAYRAARRLLGAAPAPALGPLGAAPDDPVCRRILARANPDLLVLQTLVEDGKARRFIPAEEAREVSDFFSKSPAAAPYRVAIIDVADDLNGVAANAVLKILEEPPPRGVIFLLSHAPGRLLPTIRSRCRRLAVATPKAESIVPWVQARTGADRATAARLLEMAGGAPGGAWRLADAGVLEADAAAARILASLGGDDPAPAQALADSFRGPAGAARFALFCERLAAQVHRRAVDDAGDPHHSVVAERLAEAWSQIAELPRRTEAVNLDRGEVLFSILARLRAAARNRPAAV